MGGAGAALLRALRVARARRLVDRITLALGIPLGRHAAPGARPEIQRRSHAAVDRRVLQLHLPPRPRLRCATPARTPRVRAGAGELLGGVLRGRPSGRDAGRALAHARVAAVEAFVINSRCKCASSSSKTRPTWAKSFASS